MKTSIAIQILPKKDNLTEVVAAVDEVIELIKSKGLGYEVGAFETTVEGEFDELMELIKECHLVALESSDAVSAYIKTSVVKEGHLLTIDEKITKHKQ